MESGNGFTSEYIQISKDLMILGFNQIAKDRRPDLKVGDYCYRALAGKDVPCARCPITGTGDVTNFTFNDNSTGEWYEAHYFQISDDVYGVTNYRSLESNLERQLRIVNALNSEYVETFVVDLKNNTFSRLSTDGVLRQEYIEEVKGKLTYEEARKYLSNKIVCSEDSKMVYSKTSVEAVRKGLSGQEEYSFICRVSIEGATHHYKCVYRYLRLDNNNETGCDTVIIGFRLIDDLVGQQQMIRTYMNDFINRSKRDISLEDILSRIGSFYGAERAYVYELNEGTNEFVNTYEWNNQEIAGAEERKIFRRVPCEDMEFAFDDFHEKGEFFGDIEDATASVVARERLGTWGVKSMMIAPLFSNGKVVGFAGVSNPRDNLSETLILSVVSTLIYVELVSGQMEYQKEIERVNQSYRAQLKIVSSLAKQYFCLYEVDIDNNTFYELNSHEAVRKVVESSGDARMNYDRMCKFLVKPEHQKFMREFTDMNTLAERLSDREFVSAEFEGSAYGWVEGIFIVKERNVEGRCIKVLWAIRSIAEQKEITLAAQKAVNDALNTAEKANKAKTEFLFDMSHDIRTPMNAIIGFAELLEKNNADEEKRLDYIHKIQYSSKYLLELINNVLEMARIESGKMILDESICQAKQFNDTLVAIFQEQIKAKNLKFTNHIDVTNEYVMCDVVKVNEIFLNIVSNAIKYTPEGGTITMDVQEIPSPTEGYAYYKTVIRDNGIGISPEYLPHIFEEFTREKNTTQSKIVGTGLGMSITKKLVDLMDGDIEVISEVGKGTTFTVILPHRIADAVMVDMEREKTATDNTELFKGKRILLAEDNDLNAEIAIEILSEAGFTVEHAADGVICVKMYQKAELGYYDLILMDIQMPNLNGYGATSKIRNMSDDRKNIPIVAMTANAFDEDRKAAMDVGMNGFISKPIEIWKLMQTIAEVINGQK